MDIYPPKKLDGYRFLFVSLRTLCGLKSCLLSKLQIIQDNIFINVHIYQLT